MANAAKPIVVCVDDEPGVLDGLTYTLRHSFEVVTFTLPLQAVLRLQMEEPPAVVLSDMRMPDMNGAQFLAIARETCPDSTRLLLTGQSDIESAVQAINEGQIFRFLSKPCVPAVLAKAVQDAAELHRLVTLEKNILEQTVNGCIKALVQSLSLTNPFSFGRATTIHDLSAELATAMHVKTDWRFEAATMLSLIGYIILPPDVAEKVYKGSALTAREQEMAHRVPDVTQSLVGKIPRMNDVNEIIGYARRPYTPSESASETDKVKELSLLGDILHVAYDFDRFLALGMPPYRAAIAMTRSNNSYNPLCLEALQALKGCVSVPKKVVEIPAARLREKAVLASDLLSTSGELLLSAGQELTTYAIDRIRNLPSGSIREPAYVYVEESDRVA